MNEERNAEIYRRHKDGETLSDIAKSIGFRRERARQIFHREERRRQEDAENGTEGIPRLSGRAWLVLKNLGFPDAYAEPMKVAEALSKVDNPKSLLSPNFGKKSLAEVMAWSASLGFPMKPIPSSKLASGTLLIRVNASTLTRLLLVGKECGEKTPAETAERILANLFAPPWSFIKPPSP